MGGVKENGIRKIAKNNTIKVKCHSGATTEDLIDYINPVIRKKPDVIILHGGTNDITNDIDTGKNRQNYINDKEEIIWNANSNLKCSNQKRSEEYHE